MGLRQRCLSLPFVDVAMPLTTMACCRAFSAVNSARARVPCRSVTGYHRVCGVNLPSVEKRMHLPGVEREQQFEERT